MMTVVDRKARRKGRREVTKIVSDIAVKEFLSCFYLKSSYHVTSTRELASLCKAGHRIQKIAEDAQDHLDKRYVMARNQKEKILGIPKVIYKVVWSNGIEMHFDTPREVAKACAMLHRLATLVSVTDSHGKKYVVEWLVKLHQV